MKLLLAFLIAFVSITPAAAEDKTKQAAAHYRQGKAYEKTAQWDLAIAEYKAAHALDNKASHLFNIARAFEQKGDPRGAIEFFEKFLAVESDGPNAKQARESIATASKLVADEDARKKAEAERLAKEEEAKIQALKVANAKAAADNHRKQAEAYAAASRWSNAAESYRAASDADGDPAHLLDAAAAYRKVPDPKSAKATYDAYLAKVPNGSRSDEARAAVASLAIEIEAADKAEAARLLKQPPGERPDGPSGPKKKSRFSPTWLVIGGALMVVGVIADVVPASGDNGKLDGTDFIAPALYGLGAGAVIRGVF